MEIASAIRALRLSPIASSSNRKSFFSCYFLMHFYFDFTILLVCTQCKFRIKSTNLKAKHLL